METLKEIPVEEEDIQIDDSSFHAIFYSMRWNIQEIQGKYIDLIESVANASCEHSAARDSFYRTKFWDGNERLLMQDGEYHENRCNKLKSMIREDLDYIKAQAERLLASIENARNSKALEDCCFKDQGFAPYNDIPF